MSSSDNVPDGTPTKFSRRMKELIDAGGYSFRKLASDVHADPGHLNKIANGVRPIPGPAVVAALDDALKAGGELVELANQESEPTTPLGRQPLGEVDAARARSTLQHLVALDTMHGSDGLAPVATRAFRTAADRLAVVGGTADVRSAIADLGAAAAWITSDAVERDLSRNIALEALAMADMAGDTRMHRFLLSHLSMVSEHAGRYGDALAYAERIAADRPADPRVQAMVEIRRARALSGLGSPKGALAAWDHAEHLLTKSPTADDGLTYWIHDSEMAIHKAVILSRARSRDAVDWARRGVEWLPEAQGRDQILFRAMLLHDAVIAHAWREIPGIVEDLLRHVGPAGSARVPELLSQVWKSMASQRIPLSARDAVRAAYEAFCEPAAR